MAAKSLRPGQSKSWPDGSNSAPITPWGRAQTLEKIGKGLAWAMTAGHGGLAVSAGMARKNLSHAALKEGRLMGGYYWFEEDVAWAIPFYEMDEWRVLDARHSHRRTKLTRERVEKVVAQWFKKYMADTKGRGEKAPKPPKKGDKVVFNETIEFKSRTIKKGEVGHIYKVTPGKYQILVGGGLFGFNKSDFEQGEFSVKNASTKTAGHPEMSIKLRGGEKFIAYNFSYWQWEYDSSSMYAAVILDVSSGKLRMELVDTHTKSGLGAGKRTAVKAKADMGTLSKPKVGGIASILSRHGHDRTRAGHPFSRSWTNYETNKEGPLKGIIQSYQAVGTSGQTDQALREELARNLDKLPMDVVRQLLQKV